MIFQRFNWNFFKKEKDKTTVTVVWKVEGGEIPGFIVVGGKSNFGDSWRR